MKSRSTGQILFGVAVLVVGVGFLLNALNVLDFGQILSVWWPLAVIAVGIASYISNPRVYIWPLAIVVVGILLQLKQLGWINFSIWGIIWPSLVILLGLSILFDLGQRDKAQESDDDKVNLFAAFAGSKCRNSSKNFSGGQAVAIFGGVELDLTAAKLKPGATLDVFTAFGGIDIRVPEGWSVSVRGLPIFGGWDDKTKHVDDDKKTPILNISGTCLFGGVSVKN